MAEAPVAAATAVAIIAIAPIAAEAARAMAGAIDPPLDMTSACRIIYQRSIGDRAHHGNPNRIIILALSQAFLLVAKQRRHQKLDITFGKPNNNLLNVVRPMRHPKVGAGALAERAKNSSIPLPLWEICHEHASSMSFGVVHCGIFRLRACVGIECRCEITRPRMEIVHKHKEFHRRLPIVLGVD